MTPLNSAPRTGDNNGGVWTELAGVGDCEIKTLTNGCGTRMLNAERLRESREIIGRGGARVVGDAGEDDVSHFRPENLGNLIDGFVSHCAEEQHERPLADLLGESRAQGPCPSGIVGDVDDDLWTVCSGSEALEAGRPSGLADAASDAPRSDVVSLGGEFFGGGDGEGEIPELMTANKR
jgi:hypothetical protein